MSMRLIAAGAMVILAGVMLGCSSNPTPESHAQATDRAKEAEGTVQQVKDKDPSSQRWFDKSYAYVVFPNIGQAAVGVGGAGGHGVVYKGGRVLGYATLTQGSVGLQLGGNTFSEVIFFENAASFEQFKQGQLAFDARASAVAAAAGAGDAANYQHGVLVYTLPLGGLMAQAAIGGQTFKYEPATAMASEKE